MEKNSDEGEPGNRYLFFYALSIIVFISSCEQQEKPLQSFSSNQGSYPYPLLKESFVKTAPTKKKKKIYLTFDDGPNKGTMNVLKIVKEEKVPATFFLVGEHAFASPWQTNAWDSLKSSTEIEICNHSNTHAFHNHYSKFYDYPDSVISDFKRSQQNLSLSNNIVRAPGRNSWRFDSIQFTDIKNSKATIDSLQKAGFQVMGWDLEWHYDPKTLTLKNSADQLLAQINRMFERNKTRVPDNLILLAHDQVYGTEKDTIELRRFIQELKKNSDYELTVASNYPAVKKN